MKLCTADAAPPAQKSASLKNGHRAALFAGRASRCCCTNSPESPTHRRSLQNLVEDLVTSKGLHTSQKGKVCL